MSDSQVKTDPDIVDRLRSGYLVAAVRDAADEITALRARLRHLEDAVTEWVEAEDESLASMYPDGLRCAAAEAALRRAVGR